MPFNIQKSTDNCLDCSYRTLRMFCNMGDAALERFNQLGLHVSIPGGVIVFEESQPVSNVFVVCNGRLKLSASSQEGRTMILRLAGPGDVLGLSAVLTDQLHEVTAETIEPTQLKSIRRADFLAFFEDFAEIGQNAAKIAAQEYRAAYLDARRLAISGSVAARLGQLLLDWAGSCGQEKSELRFTMSLTHEELANMCGVSRETVTRLLNQFEREKLIERRGASMIIRNASALGQQS